MTRLPDARAIRRHADLSEAADRCVLSYEQRFLRRKMLRTESGAELLVDLATTTDLHHGDALELADGRLVEIMAAPEDLIEVRGDLVRLAWHIGNRHTPAQIEPGRILILRDHVLRDMLEKLGATLAFVREPFTPEGGAYGHGRTHGHAH